MPSLIRLEFNGYDQQLIIKQKGLAHIERMWMWEKNDGKEKWNEEKLDRFKKEKEIAKKKRNEMKLAFKMFK